MLSDKRLIKSNQVWHLRNHLKGTDAMAYFKMTPLEELHTRMQHAGVDRCKVRFQLHAGEFDVFFFADSAPYVLAFGAIGRNFYFEINVDPRTLETPGVFPRDVYYRLCEILELRANPANRFTPTAFLQQVNEAMKGVTFRPVTPRDISVYRRDVEESAKIYFCGWLDNTKAGNKVTPGNLMKTRRWLGEKAYERCRDRNISSRWTDDPQKAVRIDLP